MLPLHLEMDSVNAAVKFKDSKGIAFQIATDRICISLDINFVEKAETRLLLVSAVNLNWRSFYLPCDEFRQRSLQFKLLHSVCDASYLP